MARKDPNEQFVKDVSQEEIDQAVGASPASILREKIDGAVDRWFAENVHGTVVGRDTESYNHIYRSMPVLKDMLEKALKE